MNPTKNTHSKAEQALISLLKEKCTSEKMSLVRSLSQTVVQLSRRAIARANPDIDKDQIDLIFINLHYGEDLAKKVQRYKNSKKP